MHPYPHRYTAATLGGPTALVTVTSPSLTDLPSAPPPQFGGPGGFWSPETLLCAALADCFVLTFRAIARAAGFDWSQLECSVEGTLELLDGTSQFTRFVTTSTLRVASGTDPKKARILLEKAEHGCLIANSLTGTRELIANVVSG